MRSKAKASAALITVFILIMISLAACKGDPYGLSATAPEQITVWHYYNGAQKQFFDELVTEFNEGPGARMGITVTAQSQGTVDELSGKVLDAINQKVGAGAVPDIFAAYADTAYEIAQLGIVADASKYLSQAERDAFVPAYLSEGAFTDGSLMIIPVAKSTEILMVNETDWAAFAEETGATTEAFATWEGIADVAARYYAWTDARTPDIPCDGKAFFGRDAMANYIIIGSMQLGSELFSVTDGRVTLNLDKAVFRRLWDNYYVPYISGHYLAVGRFRSDDAKTGDIIAFVGATTGATYFPREVTRPDATSYPIETAVYPLPNFEGTEPYAVQQGAGMVVTRSTEKREYAATVFLKWFTAPEQNTRFCIGSGYLPVTTKANTAEALNKAIAASGQPIAPVVRDTLRIGIDTVNNYHLYTNKAFEYGAAARAVAAELIQTQADADRAAVVRALSSGQTLDEALAPYLEDAPFEAWFARFCAEMNAAVAGARSAS